MFGKQFSTSTKQNEYFFDGIRLSNSTKFWFSSYDAHKTFVKKWFIDDNEYMTVSRTDSGTLAIEFFTLDKKESH